MFAENAGSQLTFRFIQVKPPGGDWSAFAFLGGLGALALLLLGFLGGYALGYAQRSPVAQAVQTVPASASPSPVPTGAATPRATPTSTPTPMPTPTPTPITLPTPGGNATYPICSYADFPLYPGSVQYHISPPMPNSWQVFGVNPVDVASYYSKGAYQKAWIFSQPTGSTDGRFWTLRFTHAPACRGNLKIEPGTVYQMITDLP